MSGLRYSDYPRAAPRAFREVGGLESTRRKSRRYRPTWCWPWRRAKRRARCGPLESAGLPVSIAPSGSSNAGLDGDSLVASGSAVSRGRAVGPKSFRRRAATVRDRRAGRKRPRALLFAGRPAAVAGGRHVLDDLLRKPGRNLAGGARLARAVGGIPRDRAGSTRRRAAVRTDAGAYERAFALGPALAGTVSRARVVFLTIGPDAPGARAFDMLEELADAIP